MSTLHSHCVRPCLWLCLVCDVSFSLGVPLWLQVPAAFFTFGLSIPFCVVMGGSGGAAVGSVVGSTVGFVGAAGGMYARRGSLKLGEKNMEPILKEPSERPLVSGTGSSE